MLSPGIFHTHALPTLPAQGYYTSSSLTLGKATDTHTKLDVHFMITNDVYFSST